MATVVQDEALNRRVEHVQTRRFGPIAARCAGDPAAPLLLYVHELGEGARGTPRSAQWVACQMQPRRQLQPRAAAAA